MAGPLGSRTVTIPFNPSPNFQPPQYEVDGLGAIIGSVTANMTLAPHVAVGFTSGGDRIPVQRVGANGLPMIPGMIPGQQVPGIPVGKSVQ